MIPVRASTDISPVTPLLEVLDTVATGLDRLGVDVRTSVTILVVVTVLVKPAWSDVGVLLVLDSDRLADEGALGAAPVVRVTIVVEPASCEVPVDSEVPFRPVSHIEELFS